MRRRRKRILILVSIPVALVGIYALVGFLVVPVIARDRVVQRASAALGREVTLRELRFNPFTFAASFKGLRIAGTGEQPLATCESGRVNFDPLASMFAQSWQFGEISLASPGARLVLDAGGRPNFADVIERIQQVGSGQQRPSRGDPASVRIKSIAIQNGRIHVEDHSRDPVFSTTVEPVEIALSDFSTAADGRGRYHLEGRTKRDEAFTWDGTLQVAPLRSSGRIVFQQVDLPAYRAFLTAIMRGQLVQGRAAVSADYSLSFGGERRAELRAVSIRLDSIAATLPDHTGPSVELPLVTVQAPRIDLLAREAQVERANFESVTVRAVRLADGTFDLAGFLPNRIANTSDPSAGETRRAFALTLGDLTLDDGLVVFDDRSVPEPVTLRLDEVALSLHGAPSSPAEPIPVQLRARWQDGPGSLQASGSLQWMPFRVDLEVRGSELALAPLQPYLRSFAQVAIEQGILDTQGRLTTSGPEGGPQRLTWSGSAELRHLATRDTVLDAPLFGFQSLEIRRASVRFTPIEVRIPEATLREPILHVVRTGDAKINLVAAFAPERARVAQEPPPKSDHFTADKFTTSAAKQRLDATGAQDDDTPASPQPDGETAFRLDNLTIASGTILMEDHRAEPMVATRLTGLAGTVSGASSEPDSSARIELSATLDESASLAIKGTTNLVNRQAPSPTKISLNLDNLALKLLGPYATQFLGYHIDAGRARASLAYTMTADTIEGQNHIVLRNLALGQRVPGDQGLDVPIQLALSVLRNRDGEIEIQLPIRGDPGSARFDFSSTVVDALRGVLFRAATAPFSLLGSVFGSDADALRQVEFPPGSDKASPDESSSIKALATILQDRPGLALRIHWTETPEIDTPELRRDRLDTMVRDRAHRLTPPASATREARDDATGTRATDESSALRSLFAERFPDVVPQSAQRPREVEHEDGKWPSGFFVAKFWRWITGSSREDRKTARSEPPPARAETKGSGGEQDFPDVGTMRERLLDSIEIDGARIAELARSRAEHARSALVDAGVEPNRIEIAAEPGLPEDSATDDGMPRVAFVLVPVRQIRDAAAASH